MSRMPRTETRAEARASKRRMILIAIGVTLIAAPQFVRMPMTIEAAPTVTRSLARHGAVVVTRSREEAMKVANELAPEHLVIDRETLAHGPLTAGAVFVGPYTAQAAGDHATGSNHVLPTGGAARFRGGLSAADFMRVMSVQRITRDGLDFGIWRRATQRDDAPASRDASTPS